MGDGEKWRKTILAKYGSMEAYSAHLYRVKVDKYAGGDEEKYKEIELLLNKLSKHKTTEEKIKHLERDLKPDKGNNGGRW